MNLAFNGRMISRSREQTEKTVARALDKIGPSAAVNRFLSKYGNLRTKANYAVQLHLFLQWLRQDKRIATNPDSLIWDNLACIFKSDPTDVATKRKHTDYLNEYVNDYMLRKGESESSRQVAAAAIKMFYRR